MMKLLHWQRPGRHWVLKTPHHLEYLANVFEVFPDATVVQTHRDPVTALASFCSMVAHARGMFSDRVDPREIGAHWLRKAGRMVATAMRVRDDVESGQFIDVSYSDLLRDPMDVVRRIHGQLGVPFGAEALYATQRTLSKNVRHRDGRHVYERRSFGLDEERIEACFAAYRSRFAVAREPAD